MITRPLDLASKLRREPRNLDFMFFVNVGLIALFFFLFGSRFVLAPGLSVKFRESEIVGARAGARATTSYVTVQSSNLIITDEGRVTMERLRVWLRAEAQKRKPAVLLVKANRDVPLADFTEIVNAAIEAGFADVVYAAEDASSAGK